MQNTTSKHGSAGLRKECPDCLGILRRNLTQTAITSASVRFVVRGISSNSERTNIL